MISIRKVKRYFNKLTDVGGYEIERKVRKYSPNSYFIRCDVTENLASTFSECYQKFGRIDIVINNAGVVSNTEFVGL